MQHKYHRQGCVTMKQNVEDRAAMLGEYIVENKATVRRAAKQFGVSKSTVHKGTLPSGCAAWIWGFTKR